MLCSPPCLVFLLPSMLFSADQASQYADAATQIVGALAMALATYHTHPGTAAGRHAAGEGEAAEDKVA